MLKNASTLAIVGLDTAENGPSKVRQVTNRIDAIIGAFSRAHSRAHSRAVAAAKPGADGGAEHRAGRADGKDWIEFFIRTE